MISVKNKSCLALGIAALMAAGAGVAVAEDKAPEMVDTIAAVAIAVDDLETASAFYETALGLKMMREDQGPTYVERIMAAPVDMGGTKLVLFKSLDGSATPQPARIIFSPKMRWPRCQTLWKLAAASSKTPRRSRKARHT